MVEIKHDESLDDLILSGLKIIQKKSGFRFAIDAVLLAHFTSLENKDKVIDLGTVQGLFLSSLPLDARFGYNGRRDPGDMVEMAKRSLELNNLDNIRIIQGIFGNWRAYIMINLIW